MQRPNLREPHLINKHDHFLDADLLSEQHVLLRLWHHTICGSHHKYCAFHLRRARDHVLDVIGMTGAVGVRVVACLRGVLDVRGVDGDSTSLLFGCVVDFVVLLGFCAACR